MSAYVHTVRIKEHELFEFHDFVDNFEKSNTKVKEAGVFKVILHETCENTGTNLEDLISSCRYKLSAAQKLIPFRYPHNSTLYGCRTVCAIKCRCTSLCTCVFNSEEVDFFVQRVSDMKSFELSNNCCLMFLKDEEKLFDHFCSCLERVASIIYPHNYWLVSSSAVHMPESLLRDYEQFLSMFRQMSSASKYEMVESSLKHRRSQTNEKFGIPESSKCDSEEKSLQGFVCVSGLCLEKERIMITKYFGLYALGEIGLSRFLRNRHDAFTKPSIYLGDVHSFEPIHIEDVSTYMVNFLHYGHPRVWIVVPPTSVSKLDYCMARSQVNLGHTACRNILGHKFHVPTREWLKEMGIPYHLVVQRAREAFVMCPNAAHFGFNTGVNISEAINFITKSWIPYGIMAPMCSCIDEVQLGLEYLIACFRPELLKAYLSHTFPEVDDDPYFNQAILWSKCSQYSINRKSQASIEVRHTVNEYQNAGAQKTDDVGQLSLPKRKERKLLACPKMTCSAAFAGGNKSRLLKHVAQVHGSDSDIGTYESLLSKMFPPRNKTPKRLCTLCGPAVAGRATQMRCHQQSSACMSRREQHQ